MYVITRINIYHKKIKKEMRNNYVRLKYVGVPTIITIIVALIISPAKAQKLSELDKRKGFKEFEIGDKYSKWESEIKPVGEKDDGSVIYEYTGSCCKKIFSWDTKQIWLLFENEKVSKIRVFTEDFSTGECKSDPYSIEKPVDMEKSGQEFKSLKSSLASLFGDPTSSFTNKGEKAFIVHVWEAGEIYLSLKHMYFGICKQSLASVEVYDKSIIKRRLEDGF